MSILKKPSTYTAYLLRCWLEGSTWRYSLEEIGTDKRYGFATLDELVSFMLARSILPDVTEKSGLEVAQQETKRKAITETKSSSRPSHEQGH